jgi:hypothetical protein
LLSTRRREGGGSGSRWRGDGKGREDKDTSPPPPEDTSNRLPKTAMNWLVWGRDASAVGQLRLTLLAPSSPCFMRWLSLVSYMWGRGVLDHLAQGVACTGTLSQQPEVVVVPRKPQCRRPYPQILFYLVLSGQSNAISGMH